jgi:hypothetical protein
MVPNFVSHTKGWISIEDIWEQGAEENIWKPANKQN